MNFELGNENPGCYFISQKVSVKWHQHEFLVDRFVERQSRWEGRGREQGGVWQEDQFCCSYLQLSGKGDGWGTVDLNWLYCIANVFLFRGSIVLASSHACVHRVARFLSLNSSCCEDAGLFNVTVVTVCSVDHGKQMLSAFLAILIKFRKVGLWWLFATMVQWAIVCSALSWHWKTGCVSEERNAWMCCWINESTIKTRLLILFSFWS